MKLVTKFLVSIVATGIALTASAHDYQELVIKNVCSVLRTIELEALQIFKAVLDFGGVTRAAAHLHPNWRFHAGQRCSVKPSVIWRAKDRRCAGRIQ